MFLLQFMLPHLIFVLLLTFLLMVQCLNCNVEVHNHGLSIHLSRYCKICDVATTLALAEQREHREVIAEATHLEDERWQEEEQEHLQQLHQPHVDEVLDIEMEPQPSGHPNQQIHLPMCYCDKVPVLLIPVLPPIDQDKPISAPGDLPDIEMDSDDRSSHHSHVEHPQEEEWLCTDTDAFNLFCEYHHSFLMYDPENSAYFDALCDSSTFQHVDGDADYEWPWYAGFGQSLEVVHHNYFAPFLNATVFWLMTWFYNSLISKSLQDLNCLLSKPNREGFKPSGYVGIPSAAFKTSLEIDRGGKCDPKQPEDVTNQHLLLYNGIISYIPGLESELNDILSKKLNIIIAMVSKGMSDGRSADLSSIKHKGLQYIGLNMYSKADALDPPIPEIEDKSMHRLNHPHAMAALQSGEITMTAHNWPTFFYEHDIYDAAEKTNAKPSKNCAWGLAAVIKYIIAYIHVITYFTISSTQHWTRYIGDMDLDELLWAIIGMLDDNDNPWVKDTLAWWNRKLKLDQAHVKQMCHHIRSTPTRLESPQQVASAPALQSTMMKRMCHMHPNEFSKQAMPSTHHIPERPTLSVTLLSMTTTKRLQHHGKSQPTLNQMGNTTHLQSPCPSTMAQAKLFQSDPYMPLPPKFKAQYSTETADRDMALALMQSGHGPALDCGGEQQRPRPSKQQHPSWPAPRPSSPLSDLTDNDNDFPPQAAKLIPTTNDAPLALSKQKGKKQATAALDTPQRTSSQQKNGY
ncbi:hypothetical protein EDB19DRAFT_1831223 [Suillus lakei]|nr:hypothetical protein EDB19DRAFT_1831223 [Suillus lakei]